MSELQRSIKDKLPTSQQLWNSICTTVDIKGLKLTPPIWQAMNTLDSPVSECTFCMCSLTQPSIFTDAPFSTNTCLPHVPPLPTTPSLSTLLSVVLPQWSLCCASYNIKSLYFTLFVSSIATSVALFTHLHMWCGHIPSQTLL